MGGFHKRVAHLCQVYHPLLHGHREQLLHGGILLQRHHANAREVKDGRQQLTTDGPSPVVGVARVPLPTEGHGGDAVLGEQSGDRCRALALRYEIRLAVEVGRFKRQTGRERHEWHIEIVRWQRAAHLRTPLHAGGLAEQPHQVRGGSHLHTGAPRSEIARKAHAHDGIPEPLFVHNQDGLPLNGRPPIPARGFNGIGVDVHPRFKLAVLHLRPPGWPLTKGHHCHAVLHVQLMRLRVHL